MLPGHGLPRTLDGGVSNRAARKRGVLITFNTKITRLGDALRGLWGHHARRGKGKPAGAWSVGGRKEDGMATQASRGFDFEVLRRAMIGGVLRGS